MIRTIKHIFTALLLVGLTLPTTLTAQSRQKQYIDQIKVSEVSVTPTGEGKDRAQLQMTLNLDDLKLKSNDRLILTPVLKDKESNEIVHLFPQIEVVGRNRGIIQERRAQKKDPAQSGELFTSLRRDNGNPQSVHYNCPFLYNSSMKEKELLLAQQVYGCTDCFILEDTKVLLDNFCVDLYDPQYRVSYIVPPVESVKARADKHTATLNFRVDKSQLDPQYGDNSRILGEVQNVMSEVKGDENITITSLTVAGFASPEATVAYNKSLSQRRAQAFADYLSSRFGIAQSQMRIEAPGEDWEMTRRLVAESNHTDRAAILSIIDETPNPDARDAQLKELSAGATYRWLLTELYPKVRRVEYTIAYEVRPFDVEEAREIIKTNPKLLSLNEMYLVAHSYEPLSKEFKEVFDIAARLYPKEPVVLINASAVDIEGGNYQAAIDRMQCIADNPATWNNLGVAYAKQGDLEQARQYFERASSGNQAAEAQTNLAELGKVTPWTQFNK